LPPTSALYLFARGIGTRSDIQACNLNTDDRITTNDDVWHIGIHQFTFGHGIVQSKLLEVVALDLLIAKLTHL